MATPIFVPQLGDSVRDSISGFEGVVIGITEWLYGCRRCGVQSTALHEGKPISAEWFDSPQLRVTLSARDGDNAAEPGKPGGQRDDKASARKDPTR